MIFVDTNYFLRFLLQDAPLQNEKTLRLFEEGASGKVKLFTSTIVFFEIFWVFTSYYKKGKVEVRKILVQLLQMKFVVFEQERFLLKALKLYEKENMDLEDAYNLTYARAQKAKQFRTFDQKAHKLFTT